MHKSLYTGQYCLLKLCELVSTPDVLVNFNWFLMPDSNEHFLSSLNTLVVSEYLQKVVDKFKKI